MSPFDSAHPPSYEHLGPVFRCYRDELRGPNGRICLVGFDGEHGAEGMVAASIDWQDERTQFAVGARHPILAELSYASAQIFMDSLYSCGVRPSEAAGSAGAMAAVTRHLNDMRAIVAKKVGVVLP